MDRKTYFFRQTVTDGELNSGFNDAEVMEHNIHLDELNVGLVFGMGLAQAASPSLNIQVQGPGVARDKLGQRVSIASTQIVDASVTTTPAGLPTVPLVDPRIVSIFVKFTRFDSDPRIDGLGNPIDFVSDEGFEFEVVRGAEAASPVPPALDSEFILLGDITLTVGQLAILNADIDFSRTEFVYKGGVGPISIETGRTKVVVEQLADELGGHIDGTNAPLRHDGETLDYGGGPDWHPDSGPDTNPSNTISGQLSKTIGDLASEVNPCGAERVGARPQTVGGESVTGGSIFSQTTEILTSLDGKLTTVPATETIDLLVPVSVVDPTAAVGGTGTISRANTNRTISADSAGVVVIVPLDVLQVGDQVNSITLIATKFTGTATIDHRLEIMDAITDAVVASNFAVSPTSSGKKTIVLDSGVDGTVFPRTVLSNDMLFSNIESAAIGDEFFLLRVNVTRQV